MISFLIYTTFSFDKSSDFIHFSLNNTPPHCNGGSEEGWINYYSAYFYFISLGDPR